MAPIPQPTLVDKVMTVPKLLTALTTALFRLAWWPFAGEARQDKLFKDFAYTVLRSNLSSISAAQEQWTEQSTDKAYADFADKTGIKRQTDTLPSGLNVHWFGDKKADKIVLFFHGGGYVLAASSGHFQWLLELQKELSKKHSVAVVIPSYTLAPGGQYPDQLKQAAESLQWLLNTVQKKPGEIFLAGDSAGGNLTLALLSHLVHPNPDLVNKIHVNLTEPLAGAILISPWVKFATDDESVKRNAYSDMITPQAAERWSSLFLGTARLDNYNQPVLADSTWFSGLDSRVKDILIWGGGKEVLIDSIQAIAKKLSAAHPRVETVIEPEAGHDDFILEKLLGYTNKAEGTTVIESWLAQRM